MLDVHLCSRADMSAPGCRPKLTGEAFVKFRSADDADRAQELHMGRIRNRYIQPTYRLAISLLALRVKGALIKSHICLPSTGNWHSLKIHNFQLHFNYKIGNTHIIY